MKYNKSLLKFLTVGAVLGFSPIHSLAVTSDIETKVTDAVTSSIETKVTNAETSRNVSDIESARTLVNEMGESVEKKGFQYRLNAIVPDLALGRKNTTANVDVYIKSENMLLMSLSTNSITFEDYSGVKDMEKGGAVEISINSSLPYKLNSYLVSEIQNADKSETIDKSLLNIKDSSSDEYKAFNNINEKLVLKDDCESGNDNIHNIDLRLSGGNSHVADIYKTVIKFEAEQK